MNTYKNCHLSPSKSCKTICTVLVDVSVDIAVVCNNVSSISNTCGLIPLLLSPEELEEPEEPFTDCFCGWRCIEGMAQECICD